MRKSKFSKQLDLTLLEFNNSQNGFIAREVIYNHKVNCPLDVLPFLVQEGYVKESPSGFQITYKGKYFLSNGGFTRKDFVEGKVFHYSKVAAICGIISAIVCILTLLFSLLTFCV